MRQECDWAVIGSGFGGRAAALRLAEKGYSVVVLESGQRLADDELPRTTWESAKWAWAPRLGLRGFSARRSSGAPVPANPGVNPALTITAMAERAMSYIAPADQAEGRTAALEAA